jgi:hypothetical protein
MMTDRIGYEREGGMEERMKWFIVRRYGGRR